MIPEPGDAPASDEEVEIEEMYSQVEILDLLNQLKDQIGSEINDIKLGGYRTRVKPKDVQHFLALLQ